MMVEMLEGMMRNLHSTQASADEAASRLSFRDDALIICSVVADTNRVASCL